MSPSDSMKEHGIMTTCADYWVHLIPVDRKVYWYRVDLCREFIERTNPPSTIGRSKDGTPTGFGFLIRRDSYFVQEADVSPKYLAGIDWNDLTQRQLGLAGEARIWSLIEHRVVRFPIERVVTSREKAEQFAGMDFQVKFFGAFRVEGKTENVRSQNLFVQTRERGHKVHLVQKDGEIIQRETPIHGFSEDVACCCECGATGVPFAEHGGLMYCQKDLPQAARRAKRPS